MQFVFFAVSHDCLFPVNLAKFFGEAILSNTHIPLLVERIITSTKVEIYPTILTANLKEALFR